MPPTISQRQNSIKATDTIDDAQVPGAAFDSRTNLEQNANDLRSLHKNWAGGPNWHTANPGRNQVQIDAAVTVLELPPPTRLVVGSSPYTVLASDHTIFANTSGGGIVVNLPAGIAGTTYRIINTGSAANAVTVTPDGSELIIGVAASITLFDRDVVVLTYEPTEGWW